LLDVSQVARIEKVILDRGAVIGEIFAHSNDVNQELD
jgi:hypothetical protein